MRHRYVINEADPNEPVLHIDPIEECNIDDISAEHKLTFNREDLEAHIQEHNCVRLCKDCC